MRVIGDRIERWLINDAPKWLRIPVVTAFYVVGYAILLAGLVGFLWVWLVIFGVWPFEDQ